MLAPNRRWFRFSLLTLFLSITAFGCWLGYEVNWIRNRHDALRDGVVVDDSPWSDDTPAPGLLCLFGERGYDRLVYLPEWADESAVVAFSVLARENEKPQRRISEPDLKRLQALFPESYLRSFVGGY
jgi:hypothetical protein